MNLEAVERAARVGRLYPSVILHGGDVAERREAAVGLARLLLCEEEGERPCGACRHCRRIAWPGDDDRFHPDFQVLERDLKTVTSVEATREWLRTAQVSPYEAGSQVFVIADAHTLSPEAANSLLKALEEPHVASPRHFLLLAPSQFDLLPTLRSRSLAVFLGAPRGVDPEAAGAVADELGRAIEAFAGTGAAVHLLAAAAALEGAGSWDDPRSAVPWSTAATAVLEVTRRQEELPGELLRGLLGLAEDLLAGPAMRLRGIPPRRILDGLVARQLAGPPEPGPPLGP